jgi:teichuronic acid biosynthesis glycosyltransferase TuaC
MMRVLVLTNMWPTLAEPAAGCFVKEQVDDLRARGLDVDVLAFDGRRNELNYALAALRVRTKSCKRLYDLIHAHFGLTGAVALVQRRLPVVTTFHGSDTGYHRWQLPISRYVARRSCSIVVNKDAATRLRCPAAHVVPIGVDLGEFRPIERAEARARLGWSENGLHILFPGSPQKAVKRKDLFDAVIQRLQQTDEVTPVALEGFSREQVPLVMNAADVVLMTSDSEGSPVSVKEALACLTPVVSVDVGDVRETLAGLDGCMVTSRDVDSLTAATRVALAAQRDESWRKRAERFDRRLIASLVEAIYVEALEAR